MWHRFFSLAAEQNVAIRPSFRSRLTTFTECIAPPIADVCDFRVLRDQATVERQTELVPIKLCHIPVSQVLNRQT